MKKWPDINQFHHNMYIVIQVCVYVSILLYVQAIRVTQEQRGSLKLEAYSHLLQELLIMQLHQVSIASAERTHSSDFMQVKVYLSADCFQHSSHRYWTHEECETPPVLTEISSSEYHVHWHQAVLVAHPLSGGHRYS